VKDIAYIVAESLADPASKNAVITTGEDITDNQIVALLEKTTGKKFEVTYK
jgi:nucleoside-diphosphate-sugar epimerase